MSKPGPKTAFGLIGGMPAAWFPTAGAFVTTEDGGSRSVSTSFFMEESDPISEAEFNRLVAEIESRTSSAKAAE